jgi:hypothetical protein
MDRGRAVLAVGTGLVVLILAGACAAPETTPAAAPVTVTVTTAAPSPTSTPTATPTPVMTQRPSAKPTAPVGLLSKPPTTKPKLPPVTKKPTQKPTVKKPTTQPTTRRTTKPPVTDAYYANCDAVRAAGAAPIHAGDPGYSRKLDRDGDGIGCEN